MTSRRKRMKQTIADLLIDSLLQAGVKRIYGIVGDSLNAVLDSIRRSGKIEWIGVRHEEVAAFAAGSDSLLSGSIAVCAGSSGPGTFILSMACMIAIAAGFPFWLSRPIFRAMKLAASISSRPTLNSFLRNAATSVNWCRNLSICLVWSQSRCSMRFQGKV